MFISHLLVISYRLSKALMRCHFTPVRLAKIKKCDNPKYWGECGIKGTLELLMGIEVAEP